MHTERDTKIDWGLLFVRLALAIPFIYHGAGIAFGAFGGPGLQGFAGFTKMPMPMAVLIGYGEFLGGLGILFGVLSRIASAGIAIIMLGAIVLAHLPKGYDVTKGGYEHALALFLLAVGVLIAGPGRYTALALLRGNKRETQPQQTAILR